MAMHPFGCDAGSSLQDLFAFFKRCLQQGEWELASACVPQLVSSTGELSECLKKILKAIVCHPYILKWESVGSPHKLAWFWLQVLEKSTEVQVSPTVRTELEFLLLLEELGEEDIPLAVLKELQQAFLDAQTERKGPGLYKATDTAVEYCLRILLERKKPRLAQVLAQYLQGSSPGGRAWAPVVQHAFVLYLMERLGRPETDPGQLEAWLEEVYTVLALMPWSADPSRGQLEELWQALWEARDGPLREERVLSSLLRPQCYTLVSHYSAAALCLQRAHQLRSIPDTLVDLPEAERLVLSLCCQQDRSSAWKTIYFECLSSGKHFLEQVLVTALALIKQEEFSWLKDMLKLEFRPLSRLLLLLGWTQCRSLSSAQTLLQVLHHEQPPANDSVLQEFANLLSSQLGILEWCKDNSPGVSMEAVLEMLQALDSHSALYILHSLTPVAQLDERRVLDLLQQLPKAGHTEVMSALSPAVERNVVLFKGFCAMKYALYALCIIAHKYASCADCGVFLQQRNHSSEGAESQTSAPTESYQSLFQHYVSECQLYLEAVPAMFRLELLENIFSLLFLSHADFTQPGTRTHTVAPPGAGVPSFTAGAAHLSYLDLGHFTQGCRGFLVDVVAMEGFLKLLKEGLEGVCLVGQKEGRVLAREAQVAERLGCSVTAHTFVARMQRLSKRTAEAQWRLQIVTSNLGNTGPERLLQAAIAPAPYQGRGSSSSLRRRKRAGRHAPERRASMERHNGDVSTSASDGGLSVGSVRVEQEQAPHSWLVPAMLASPESLLLSCVRRGNYIEAHQVNQMFGLDASPCCGELLFMELYEEVLKELAQVEHKMESQPLSSSSSSSEGLGALAAPGPGRSRLGSRGRSTLQAIGSAAAAGMAFYSISDIAERLVSTPGHPVPCLEEGYWLSRCTADPSSLLVTLLEEASPSAMAAFDLACCHCHLWKTSRQLLDVAERRLNSSLEARGLKVDPKVARSEISGFPMVLQRFSNILNHSASNQGPVRAEGVGEDHVLASPFGCSLQEVLLSSHATLTEESIASRLLLDQRLEHTLHVLNAAMENTESCSGNALLTALVEQASLKQSELDSHPVRSSMKQLLRCMDQLCSFEQDVVAVARPDYMRCLLDYVNTLASVIVRSLSSEDQASEVKLGNPLLVLLQSPSQLLSHLLFDRQVSPDRLLSLLQQEGVGLSVQQVIIQRCCDPLPLWSCRPAGEARPGGEGSITSLFLQLAQEHMAPPGGAQGHTAPPGGAQAQSAGSASESSDASVEAVASSSSSSLSTSPPASSSSPCSPSSSFLLTASALSFLKSCCPLLALLACLSGCRGEPPRSQPSGWSGYFRSGRRDALVDGEQAAREADVLLKGFPVLRAHLEAMAAPVLGGPGEEGSAGGLGAALCGKPLASLLLCGPQSQAARAAAARAFQQALASRDLGRALSLLELYGQGCSQEGALRDRLLACAALEDAGEGVGHLFRVQDPSLRARVALQALERWPLPACVDLLDFCLDQPGLLEDSLRASLELQKKELVIYRWMLNLQPPLPWATWQELRNESKINSESMFSLMLEAREFSLCAQWVELYPVSEQLQLQLQTEHLLHLLEQGEMEEAFQMLEGLDDSLEVCEHALDRRPGFAACHFLADYVTLHFQSQLSPARRRHIHAVHLGSKVLLTLPLEARQEYFPLLPEPLLMLEQLLMNLKVEWAGVAVRTLKTLLVAQDTACLSMEDIDQLLSLYAAKALDFPYAPRERSRSDSVLSLQDALLQCPADCFSPPGRLDSPASSTGSTPTHTVSSSSSDRDKDRMSVSKRTRSTGQYQPPENPPARKDWVPDNQQHVCMVCQRERFTMFNRRHHCRRCGRLVCNACSEHKMRVVGWPEEEVRVCDQCYIYSHPDSDDELEEAEVVGSPGQAEGVSDGLLHLPEVVHRNILLSSNRDRNQLLRSEFYYEQAPSAYLCVALLDLHSDNTACGHQLIGHTRALSRQLNSPEVDACLLTDVMRQLLVSAKLMFVKVGRSQDLPLCDSYISKVDVLKILVSANYKYIPSLDDILETTAITRLRNQLLEAEYYQLAVEVSTKSGLDPGGVWHAWAMALLKAGNLSAAREKFSRCLKPPLDRNQLSMGPCLLQDIVQHLEFSVRPSLSPSNGDSILAPLRELEEALRGPLVDRAEGQGKRSVQHQECLHYLHAYGTHLALVSYYMRHDCLKEALTHLLSKECPEEVFLEGVLQPSMERGRLGVLQAMLETLDPGLDSCSRYLLASCQHLQRKGYFHSLYQLQQFTMDHVRAAMTCIRFFTQGAHTYLQLGEQQRWLVRAKEHLRTYLQEQQGRGATRRKCSVNSFRKTMSSSDVSRHMNTIELQLEVTRFLHRCEAANKAPQTSPANSSGSSALPTLFGGTPMKVEVACKVMLGGKNIEEGFGIAYRVIQDFQLEAQAVYVRAGQRLVHHRQYGAVRQLLKCVGESGTATKNDCDAIVINCVRVADKGPSDAKELESLILETRGIENKIKAYLLCGKLRPAYLLAVKQGSSRAGPLVLDVLEAAQRVEDSVMQNICRQWLSEHQSKAAQSHSRPNAR